MSDEFDDIVNGESEDETPVEFEQLIDVVAHYWKKFHPGHHFIKGVLIVETAFAEENKTGFALHHETSEPINSWQILGMLESVKQTFAAESVVSYLTLPEEEQGGEATENE